MVSLSRFAVEKKKKRKTIAIAKIFALHANVIKGVATKICHNISWNITLNLKIK